MVGRAGGVISASPQIRCRRRAGSNRLDGHRAELALVQRIANREQERRIGADVELAAFLVILSVDRHHDLEVELAAHRLGREPHRPALRIEGEIARKRIAAPLRRAVLLGHGVAEFRDAVSAQIDQVDAGLFLAIGGGGSARRHPGHLMTRQLPAGAAVTAAVRRVLGVSGKGDRCGKRDQCEHESPIHDHTHPSST